MREAVFTDVMGSVEELQVLTDRMRVLTSGTSTGGRYELFEVIGGPGGMAPLHQHPWDEDYYVLEGALAIIVEGVRYTYGKGDALRVAAGTAHTFEVPEGGCRFLMLTSPSAQAFSSAHWTKQCARVALQKRKSRDWPRFTRWRLPHRNRRRRSLPLDGQGRSRAHERRGLVSP
jgi:quercetin dioxygenase-like cupin family protein